MEKERFDVAIIEPYLTRPMDDIRQSVFEESMSGAHYKNGIYVDSLEGALHYCLLDHGINPNNPSNFFGVHEIITSTYLVKISSDEYSHIKSIKDADLTIASGKVPLIPSALEFANNGILLAQYGGDEFLEGYSIHLPNRFDISRSFITTGIIVESIRKRKCSDLVNAIEIFNEDNETEVKISPQLTKTLSMNCKEVK